MIDENLKAHFFNLYKLALIDHSLDDREFFTILGICEEKGISKKEFEQIIIDPHSLNIQQPTSFFSKIDLLYDYIRVIWADQIVKPEEKELFIDFCTNFDFDKESSQELFEWLLQFAQQNLSNQEIHIEINKLNNSTP